MSGIQLALGGRTRYLAWQSALGKERGRTCKAWDATFTICLRKCCAPAALLNTIKLPYSIRRRLIVTADGSLALDKVHSLVSRGPEQACQGCIASILARARVSWCGVETGSQASLRVSRLGCGSPQLAVPSSCYARALPSVARMNPFAAVLVSGAPSTFSRSARCR